LQPVVRRCSTACCARLRRPVPEHPTGFPANFRLAALGRTVAAGPPAGMAAALVAVFPPFQRAGHCRQSAGRVARLAALPASPEPAQLPHLAHLGHLRCLQEQGLRAMLATFRVGARGDDKNPGYRRCRLHRLGRGSPSDPGHRSRGGQPRQADLRRQPGVAGLGGRLAALPLLPGGYLRCASPGQGLRRVPTGCRDAPGRRVPRRPLHRRSGGLHPDQQRRRPSASTISPPTRYTATCMAATSCLSKPPPTRPARPIRHPRPVPTIWCAPGSVPTACRAS